MKRTFAALPLLTAAALSAGCVGFARLPAKEQRFAPGFYLTPQVEWSTLRTGTSERWTIHGFGLENVFLAKGIADGQPLVKPSSSKENLPLFRKPMTGSEITELASETMQRRGLGEVRALVVRPETFGGQPGFSADLALKTAEGLELSGLVAGAVVKDKLYLLIFSAPRIHYFPTYVPTVEKVIASARFE
jgi:hypothetical protein